MRRAMGQRFTERLHRKERETRKEGIVGIGDLDYTSQLSAR